MTAQNPEPKPNRQEEEIYLCASPSDRSFTLYAFFLHADGTESPRALIPCNREGVSVADIRAHLERWRPQSGPANRLPKVLL